MEKVLGNYFIIDSQERKVDTFDPDFIFSGKSIYEVMHIIDGVPLFHKEHFLRLQRSADLLGIELPFSHKNMLSWLKMCMESNQKFDGNIKMLYKFKNGRCFLPIKVLFFIEAYERIESDYTNGVHVESLAKSRNKPNIKLTNRELRNSVNTKVQQANLNEVILTTQENYVTEGSRSNIFFVKNGNLYTPRATDILPGITREKVFEIARELNITITEKPIHSTEVKEMEAMFLSSTSRRVLPVVRFDNTEFDVSNEIIQVFMKKYDAVVSEYVNEQKAII